MQRHTPVQWSDSRSTVAATGSPVPGPRPCRNWSATGACRFGDRCDFAHGSVRPHRHRASSYADRVWSHAQASTSGRNSQQPPFSFSFMSYNILADELAFEHAEELYSTVKWSHLLWEHRLRLLVKEIRHWLPDIICMQEVDHLEDLEEALESIGYEGRYAARTGGRCDGCATFWKRAKFVWSREEAIEFCQADLRDNVALLVMLHRRADAAAETAVEVDDGGLADASLPGILVGNTHVLFNPKRGDIKLGQVRMLMEAAARLRGRWPGGAFAVFGGDYNSLPGSAIYRFLRRGALHVAREDRREMSGQGIAVRNVFGRPGVTAAAPPVVSYLAAAPDMAASAIGDGASSGGAQNEQAPAALLSDLQPAEPCRHTPVVWVAAQATSVFRQSDGDAGALVEAAVSTQVETICGSPVHVSTAKGRGAADGGSSSMKRNSRKTLGHMSSWALEDLQRATGNQQPEAACLPGACPEWLARHGLQLESAYGLLCGAEPPFTSAHGKFVGTVDYIWYTPQAGGYTLRPLQVLLPPPLSALRTGLPAAGWPSDHVCIMARFGVWPQPERGEDDVPAAEAAAMTA